MKINRCKSLFGSFKQVLKNIKNCLNNLHKLVIPEGLYRESQPLSGFTLLEVIVAIIIIGALLAFALPKYETALDKSRFSTLMPITKSIKDAEEIFYVASNQYTPDIQSLDVKTNPGETVQISVVDDDDYSYVQAIDPRIDNIYKAYLKHSTNFAEERHCEALSDSSRAKKVCENLGGMEVGENGNYIAYSLDSNGGHGTFEKDCEDAQPDTEQTCASGCGMQTRTVTCNRRTGTWETGDFEGDCPVQGDTTQSCTNGVGTETRTFNCEGNTWVAGEWDISSCTCDPEEKPDEEQACTHGGTMTRSVTCDTNSMTWQYGTWDESACECDPDNVPDTEKTCDSGCGTLTRTNSCVNGEWVEGTWTGSCAGPKPDESKTCSSGCGTQTRTISCTNGAWVPGSWTGSCPSKPSTTQSCTSGTGTETRTVTCKNGAWSTGSWNTSNCTCDASTKPSNSTVSCPTGGSITKTYVCSGTSWVVRSTSNGCTMSGLDWYDNYNTLFTCSKWDSYDGCSYSYGNGVSQYNMDQGNMFWHIVSFAGEQRSFMRYTSEGYIYQFGSYNGNTGLYDMITFSPSAGDPRTYTITSYTTGGDWGNYSDKVSVSGSGTVTKDASGNFVLSNGTVIPALNSSNFTMRYPNKYGN